MNGWLFFQWTTLSVRINGICRVFSFICLRNFSVKVSAFNSCRIFDKCGWVLEANEPCDALCHKMVKHTLEILGHLLQFFKGLSNHFATLRIKGLNEIKYWRADRVKPVRCFKGCLPQVYLVHSWILCPKWGYSSVR